MEENEPVEERPEKDGATVLETDTDQTSDPTLEWVIPIGIGKIGRIADEWFVGGDDY